MKQQNKSTVFLTGATGLVGSYLLKILLQLGHKVFMLARSKDKKNANERVRDVLNFWDKEVYLKYQDNIVVLEGELGQMHLGLNKREFEQLLNETESIFHSGAVTEFNRPLETISKINTEGTKNILEIAAACKNLKKVNHISTAYVCGNFNGVFRENDLDVGQKFNTTYEESKFKAEIIVNEYRNKGLWIDIFRPPIIVGELATGKTTKLQGFYQLLHIWDLELFDIFPGKEILMNMVPVDALCESILRINNTSSNKNMNFHPFPKETVALEHLLSLYADFKEISKPKLVIEDEFKEVNLTAVQKSILKYNVFSFASKVALNSEETNTTLKKMGYEFPKLDDIALLNLFKYTALR